MAVAELEKGSEDPLDRQIDFESLQRLNPDIIGWIYAPQIEVDQPILKGSSDTEYLNRDFEGNYSPLGSIFTWAHAEERLSDAHLCLFGHNMISGQMFGRLDAFTEESFRYICTLRIGQRSWKWSRCIRVKIKMRYFRTIGKQNPNSRW